MQHAQFLMRVMLKIINSSLVKTWAAAALYSLQKTAGNKAAILLAAKELCGLNAAVVN